MDQKRIDDVLGSLSGVFRHEYYMSTGNNQSDLFWPVATKEKWWCTCGVENLVSEKNCKRCGIKINYLATLLKKENLKKIEESYSIEKNNQTIENSISESEPNTTSGITSEQKTRYCQYCGTELQLESKFCSVCGNKVNTIESDLSDAGKTSEYMRRYKTVSSLSPSEAGRNHGEQILKEYNGDGRAVSYKVRGIFELIVGIACMIYLITSLPKNEFSSYFFIYSLKNGGDAFWVIIVGILGLLFIIDAIQMIANGNKMGNARIILYETYLYGDYYTKGIIKPKHRLTDLKYDNIASVKRKGKKLSIIPVEGKKISIQLVDKAYSFDLENEIKRIIARKIRDASRLNLS